MRGCGLGAWRGGEGRKRGNVCVQVWPGAQEALTVSALLACIVCVGVAYKRLFQLRALLSAHSGH